MRALVACERSGRVRDALIKLGWNAVSCDLHPSDKEGEHFQCDVRDVLNDHWDLMVGFPPCTYLTVSGNRHIPSNPERWVKRFEALKFVWELYNANIPYIALENPVGVLSTYLRKPDQIIHPYHFGDPVPKQTCLWLKNLPVLKHTKIVEPEYVQYNSKKNKSGKSKYSIYGKTPSTNDPEAAYERGKTFPGIADAMAKQWTEYILKYKKL